MAGAVVAGELSEADARARAGDVEFAVATRADEAELRALLRTTPTPGAVSLRFERELDYFAGENVAGARDATIVARRGGHVVCMGRCSRRTLYVDGVKRDVGYLSELRLAPGTERGLAVLRAGYAFFAELEKMRPAEVYFTSVAETNRRARTVLENGRRLGLPGYTPLAELVTYAWPVRRNAVVGSAAKREAVSARKGLAEPAELIEFLDTQARRQGLAMPWDAATLDALSGHGLAAKDFCVVRRGGRIVAAGGVWDQRAWRQTVVAGYAGTLRCARPWLNAIARLAGRPGLPAAGEPLRQACVHPLAVAAEATEAETGELLAGLEARAERRGVEWLVASVAAGDALRAVLEKRSGARDYTTRLYAVRLAGVADAGLELEGWRARPEAGLL